MATSLSTLAQFCAEAGFDLFDEDLGPHWGQCVAAWLAWELPFEDDEPAAEPVPGGAPTSLADETAGGGPGRRP